MDPQRLAIVIRLRLARELLSEAEAGVMALPQPDVESSSAIERCRLDLKIIALAIAKEPAGG